MTIHPPTTVAPDQPPNSEYLASLRFDRGTSKELRRTAASGDQDGFISTWTTLFGARTRSGVPPQPERAFEWTPADASLTSAWRTAFSQNTSDRPVIASRSHNRFPLPTIIHLDADATDGDLLASLALLTRKPPPRRNAQWLSAWRRCIELTSSRPLSAELAYTAGLLLSPLKGTSQLRRDGQMALREELLTRTDDDGTPLAETLPELPEWLGGLVRAGWWSQQLGEKLWTKTSSARFAKLVRWVTPLLRHGDRLAMSNRPARSLRSLLESANQLIGGDAPPTVTQSDRARVAVLRDTTSVAAPSVVVAHDGPLPRLDISIGDRTLLCGEWSLEVTSGQHNWHLDRWDCVCWQSDDDADYIELQAHAGDGRRVDRHILLSRAEHLLVLADAILTPAQPSADQPISCRSSLPLAQGITTGAVRNGQRDQRLKSRGISARVVPLALPDDPLLSSGPSSLTCHDSHLSWSHAGRGPGLFLPLVVDLAADRRRRKAEWNPLTVTEDRKIVSPSRAAAYRLRIGELQLVLYRSLAETSVPRSVIGQHTLHESFFGLLRPGDDFSPLVMVE